jgi:translation initiation factor IF-2
MRVHELASELGMTSKELMGKLKELGLDVKSHMSSINEDSIELMRAEYGGESPGSAAPQPAEEAAERIDREEAPPAETEEAAEEKREAGSEVLPETPQPAAEPAAEEAEEDRTIHVKGSLVVKDLAGKLGIKPNALIAELMQMNILASINQKLDINVVRSVAEKHGFAVEQEKRGVERKAEAAKKKPEKEEAEKPENLEPRPPVVTMIGHVDHGKTSLLDKIRNTAVTASEDGGITQHIGAYTIEVNGRNISFLDTPGHAAFTAMRARGANLTDIAVIVIAADDGVMPQTREAVKHAQAAGVSIMVAINKMDLPGANPDKVKQQLQGIGLAPEDWGGDVICCPVSATAGDGIENLLEMILLQSEVLELKANYRKRAQGFVIEAQMEPGMGPTANLLVKSGTLKVGDPLLCGSYWGRIRALINDRGARIKAATPSVPVKCLGLSGIPDAGAEFRVCESDKAARAEAEEYAVQVRVEQRSKPKRASLEDLYDHLHEETKEELRIIVKADTQGSVEAITSSLQAIESDKVNLNILLSGTGNVNANDVALASASNAIIIGFHVGKDSGVNAAARHEGVEVRLHSVIYELIDEVKNAMTGLLAPRVEEKVLGHATVKQVFPVGKRGRAAGCQVEDGAATSNSRVRIKREDEVIYEGRVLSLRRYQDDVRQVRQGQECGVMLESYMNFREGDILEFYELEEVEETL